MLKIKLIAILVLKLAVVGCNILPEAGPAPVQLQIMSNIEQAKVVETVWSADKGSLLIETPQAAAALQSRNIWYQTGKNQLTPFRDHIWSEPLSFQIERLAIEYLTINLPGVNVLSDRPGVIGDKRLRVHLHQWHLDPASQQLLVTVHVGLVNANSQPIVSWQWKQLQPLADVSPQGLAAASQIWVDQWLAELNHRLLPYMRAN